MIFICKKNHTIGSVDNGLIRSNTRDDKACRAWGSDPSVVSTEAEAFCSFSIRQGLQHSKMRPFAKACGSVEP